MDFDALIERRGTASLKWDKYKDRDVIPMWVADMDFRSPQAIIKAVQERTEHGVFGYSEPPEALIEAVLAMLQREYGWVVQPDWLVWLPGLVTGLNVVCRAVGTDGEAVMTATPVYHPFLSAPKNSRRRLIEVPLVQHGERWVFDFERLESAITSDTRLFLLCHPHNPVGRVYEREELLQLAAICEKYDIVICSDEIHCQLILDRDKHHVPTATLDQAIAERTITLMAPSKTFNLAGLGCAFAIVPNTRLHQDLLRVTAGIVPRVNVLGYTAALAAYRDCDDWHAALLDYLRGNRDRLEETVAGLPGLSMPHVEATYLGWIDTSATGLDDPAAFFERAGLGFSDGRQFGGPGFVRFNFGCPRPLLQQALDRLGAAMGNLGTL